MHPAKQLTLKLIFAAIACCMISSCSGLTQSSPEQDAPPGADPAIEALQEQVVTLEQKVSTLEAQLAGQKNVVYTIEYSDPAQLYQEARTLLVNKQANAAADLFATFVDAHPDHELADNALYWLGECHYSQGKYPEAIDQFKKLISDYPKGSKVPDALLKTGYAYISMDELSQARTYLKQVITQYPFSPVADKAQVRLQALE